ncbi:PREDICTED: kinesin-like protein KIF15 [Amphimedon queenslandica]|nr:PREDICTED: kinesin-like protein KIF15 [Amphimedon queenslandica]|eukprot:XP_019858444.1 PREDICTED: kinesin-like protein KIF15 [Amphimedon queenslandica]
MGLESDKNQLNLIINELQEIIDNNNEKIREQEVELSYYSELKRDHELLKTQQLSLEYKLETYQTEHINSEGELLKRLESLKEDNEILQERINALTMENDTISTRLEETTLELTSCKGRLSLSEEQLNRLQEQEELTFKEKEELRSSLEILQEEKSKLQQEYQEIVKENASLSGHRNLRQRIQFHADLKEKYHKLLEDHRVLEEKFQSNSAAVAQALLMSKDQPVPSQQRVTRSKLKGKENISKIV